MVAKATLAISSVGRAGLVRTVRDACRQVAGVLSEVLVLDNSDGSLAADAVRSAAGAVSCRILTADPTRGRGRNLLLDQAGTDLVCFTDDDCLPADGWAAALVGFMETHPGVAAGFGRVEPTPRPGAVVRVVSIDGVGQVAWGEANGVAGSMWCPAITVPTWEAGIVRSEPTVPWARAGSSNNLVVRRSQLLPGRPAFLSGLGPGSRAGSGEDTELGYALMAAGRPVAHIPEALVLHDSWLPLAQARRKRLDYFRGNTEALGYHVVRGDTRATELLLTYWRHFCEVNDFASVEEVLRWAYGPETER